MSAASEKGEGAALYEAVKAVGMDLCPCPALGVGVPVGKDSLSMAMCWTDRNEQGRNVDKEFAAPLGLIVTSYARVQDVWKTQTPALRSDLGTVLVLLDFAQGNHRLGGSTLVQVCDELGRSAPDVDGFGRAQA